jgi:5-methylcytosine-specific restriction endonuclease McrA
MARREFSKATKREALKRSGMLCEAVGGMYNLPAGKRCNTPLGSGVEYDHIVLEANSHDNSLENCAAVCVKCHRWKSAKHDTPMAAKTVRMQDKANGITRPVQKIKSAPFPQSAKSARRAEKPPLPPKSLFKPAEERT